MNLLDVIERPVITEKSMLIVDDKKYAFEVDTRVDKTLVKQAIKAAFDVGVRNVNIVNVHAKFKRMDRYAGYIKKRHKAIVTLTEDSGEIRLSEAAE